MIHDPKTLRLNENAPPTACPCGRPFESGDAIVAETDATNGVTTYWHRACLTDRIEKLIAEQSRRMDESGDPTIARLRAALRKASHGH